MNRNKGKPAQGSARASSCGKTLEASLAAGNPKGRTSVRSLRRSSTSQSQKPPLCLSLKADGPRPDASMTAWGDGALLGAYTTHSFGVCPKEDQGSRLSQILQDSPPPKYYLSARACLGILNRAKRRGKQLPPELEQALIRQAALQPPL